MPQEAVSPEALSQPWLAQWRCYVCGGVTSVAVLRQWRFRLQLGLPARRLDALGAILQAADLREALLKVVQQEVKPVV